MYGATGGLHINVSLAAVQNLGRGRANSTDVLRGFRQTLRANTMTAHLNRSRPLPATSFAT
jgi:hypothetical protein